MARRLPLLLRLVVAHALLPALLLTAPARAAEADPVGVWPLMPVPEVVAGFDPPSDPWGAGHRGVDLLGSPGQTVRASLAGRVTWAGMLAGRGVVVVDHGSTRTTYEPVDATVGVGATVAAGDPLGHLTSAGSHCPPRACLHWGWIRGETYLDPLRLVGVGPVRLLPLWRDRPVGDRMPAARSWVPALPYAGWTPMLQLLHGWESRRRPAATHSAQARGCACW